ncbi:MAG: murein biosynthesis integral membrane protein MurJ [Deltaproteobacteria bacterium]|nr:murein biosynthesis integral membrane protein MurJ [Deltaproteobacteria bacterium]
MSERREITRAAGTVGLLTVVSRVTGLVRDAVVSALFGAGLAADAFFVAYRIPNLLRRLVGEGAASAAFIPVLTDYHGRRGRAEADHAARVLFTVMAAVLTTLAAAGMLLAGPLTATFAPGFAATPEKLALAIRLTRLVFPYLVFIGLVAVAMGVLNALRDFTAPALSPVVLNVVIVASALALTRWIGVYSLAVGILLGGLAQLLVQVPALRRMGVPLSPCWEPRHPAVARVGALMIPTLFGSAVYQLNVLVNTMFASLLPAGSISFLWYAERLFEFPLGVFAVALSTAALPSFSALAQRDPREFRDTVAFALRLVNVIALPASVGLMVTAEPLTSVLFQRGAFGAHAAEETALAVRCFAVGLWSVASVRMLVPAFYALEDTRSPVVAAAGAFVANLVGIALFAGPLTSPGGSGPGAFLAAVTVSTSLLHLRHGGLALATSFAGTVNLLLLCLAYRWRVGAFPWGAWLGSALRTGTAALVMVPIVRAITTRVAWFSGTVPLAARAAWLVLAVAAGTAAFVVALAAIGGPEAVALRSALRRRLSRARA